MNTTYTDEQLKLALAKMLPEKFYIDGITLKVHWRYDEQMMNKVRETEWLHVCWLITEQLRKEDGGKSVNNRWVRFCRLTQPNDSWQQRAIVLAKVKGVEIV